MSVSLLALLCSTALAAPDGECTFTDVVSQELRACEEGPSEAAMEYVVYEEGNGYVLVKEAEHKFEPIAVYELELESSVSEDPEYDDDPDAAEERNEAWEALLSFLKLFVLVVQGADAYIDALGLTGSYDGVVCHGSGSPCVDAYMELQHSGSAVDGRVVVLGSGLHVGAGLCGGLDIPVISLPVHATSTSGTHADGGTTRQVDYTFFFTGDATVDFDLDLQSDRETLDVDIELILEDPCADSDLTGTFTRRMDALFDL